MRGAWIEIVASRQRPGNLRSRSPCGERGLKLDGLPAMSEQVSRRSPCGERGLKCKAHHQNQGYVVSLPVRGAWIEIASPFPPVEIVPSLPVRGAWIEMAIPTICITPNAPSLPVRGAWIEICRSSGKRRTRLSLPVRGAWIEISTQCGGEVRAEHVAPRAGSVD